MDLERMMQLLEDERLLDGMEEQGGLLMWYRRGLECRVWLADSPVEPQTLREWIRKAITEREEE